MQERASESSASIESLDLLRGAVMVLMLLDHTRAFTHPRLRCSTQR